MSPKLQRVIIAEFCGWRRWKYGDPWVRGLKLADQRFNGFRRTVLENESAESRTIKLDIDEAWTQQVKEVIENYVPVSHWISSDGIIAANPPDYPNDLNAIHDAIMKVIVRGKDIIKFYRNEGLFQENLDYLSEREQVPVWHFGAALYSEAFLRTVGKWSGE